MGICIDRLPKPGKDKPVIMDVSTNPPASLNGGFDDMIEIPKGRSLVVPDVIPYGISEATARNWKKLNTKLAERLTARANKRKSIKRILPLEYIRYFFFRGQSFEESGDI